MWLFKNKCPSVYSATLQERKAFFSSEPQPGCALVMSHFHQNSLQNDKLRRRSQALSAPDVPDGVLCWTIWEVIQDRTTATAPVKKKKDLASEWLKHLFVLPSVRAQLETIGSTKCTVHSPCLVLVVLLGISGPECYWFRVTGERVTFRGRCRHSLDTD